MKRKLQFEDERHSIMYYICLVVPPVFILGVLSRIPLDFGSAILWLGAGLYTLKSILKTMYLLFYNLDQHGIHPKRWKKRAKLLSESAVILAYTLAIYSVNYSWEVAKKFTLETAEQVQEECKRSRCPESLEGWEVDRGGSSFLRVGKCAKYGLHYSSDGPHSFRFSLRQNIDGKLIIRGGRDIELITQELPE
ncbi:MAG: hypothetical protein D3920_04425 [Candidatus Electrothrix sp. AW2]|nr:hypothetical protein [Candidatus Electrothrix gigas]